MQDRKTRIYLEKLDADTGESVTGGYYCVRDIESGETVFCYTASGKPVLAEGILAAGRTYELAEEKPPAGYGYCESIVFTVPLEPETITVRMKDKKNRNYCEEAHSAVSGKCKPVGCGTPKARIYTTDPE